MSDKQTEKFPEGDPIEQDVRSAGFANSRQAREALELVAVPLDRQLQNRVPESAEWIAKTLAVAEPGPPGLSVRTVQTKVAEKKHVIWCDDQGKVRGIAIASPLNADEKEFGVNAFAVDLTLPQFQRGKIAKAISNELFRRDWARHVGNSVSPKGVKARHHENLQRLRKLQPNTISQLLTLENATEETRTSIAALLATRPQ